MEPSGRGVGEGFGEGRAQLWARLHLRRERGEESNVGRARLSGGRETETCALKFERVGWEELPANKLQ